VATRYYVGIDPGFTGGIAIIDSKDNIVDIIDCPLIIVSKGRKKIVNFKRVEDVKYRVDSKSLHSFLEPYKEGKFLIEHAQSMPGEGSTSSFSYGEGYGRYLGVLDSLGVDYIEVKSNVWKPKLGLNRDKKLSVQKAQELIPSCKELIHLVKHNGRAEALLMSWYLKYFR
jgi:hypothetical protein